MPGSWRSNEVTQQLRRLHAVEKASQQQSTGTDRGTMPIPVVPAAAHTPSRPVFRVIRGGLAVGIPAMAAWMLHTIFTPVLVGVMTAITALNPAAQNVQSAASASPSPWAAATHHHRRRAHRAPSAIVAPVYPISHRQPHRIHKKADRDPVTPSPTPSAGPSPTPSATPTPTASATASA